jgi:hypothetical protein
MPNRSRTLLRAAAVAVTSAAALASVGAASADAADDARSGGRLAGEAILSAPKYLPVNPLARTNVNPLTNSVGSQVADFKPVSTADVTQPIADSRSVADLPLLGNVFKTPGAVRACPGSGTRKMPCHQQRSPDTD